MLRELRLVIAERPTRRDHLHGAWWPRSSDVENELTPMLQAVGTRFGPVVGVMLNREEWPGVPLTWHPADLGRTKVSWYGLSEPHLAVLRCSAHNRIAILVLPPETLEEIALTATLMAAAPGNSLTTSETLTTARTRVAAAARH